MARVTSCIVEESSFLSQHLSGMQGIGWGPGGRQVGGMDGCQLKPPSLVDGIC